MPFGTPPPDDLEDGEIPPYDDDDEVMSETSDSDESVPGFSRNRAFAEYWNDGAGITLAQMGEELPMAMQGFLGRNRSTELITQMVRTGDTAMMHPHVVALLLSDHGEPYALLDLSYRQATARQYADLKTKVGQAASWLLGRGTTDYVLREVLAHLEVSQRECAQVDLREDKGDLGLLIQAGLLQSRRMVWGFDIRIGLAKRLAQMFEETGHWAGMFVPGVVEAMPRLTAAYQGVIDALLNDSSAIPEEIKFQELWDADMVLEPLERQESAHRPRDAATIPALWRDDNEMPPPQVPAIRTRQPVNASGQAPAQAPMWTATPSLYRDNNEARARAPSVPSLSPLTNAHIPATSIPSIDLTPSTVEQQRQRVFEAAFALSSNADRPALAANYPYPLPSLAELEEQARQLPAYVVEPRESFVRNGGQRRNGISGGRRADR